ncbi:unnamed protein product [Somion occarium]|uniref:Uncharacterized protein n=1 Tax=Somion occarium TaxID=3059160 RepID=A0ABP1DBE7_9APHY
MPSLRRTLSSPSVRSSPYSHSYSSLLTRQGGHGPRRSSGSETSQRRVLADLDWWRVQEGQRELRGLPPLAQPVDAPEDTQHDETEAEPAQSVPLMTDVPLWQPAPGSGGAMHESELNLFSSVISGESPSVSNVSKSLSPQFAALSISSRIHGHRRLISSSESSVSSLESTPSSIQASLCPMSDMGFGDIVPHISDDDDALFTPSIPRSLTRRLAPVGRSVSYSYIESELSRPRECQFEDIFDDAFDNEFFAQTRTDVDDLFN